MELEIRKVEWGTFDYVKMLALRDKILRRPLGLNIFDDPLEAEAQAIHLAAFYRDRVIGTAVLFNMDNGCMRLKQMSVDEDFHGVGTGKRIIQMAEEQARSLHCVRIELHARASAVGFYLKCGFEIVGEPFEEVSIRHRAMVKML